MDLTIVGAGLVVIGAGLGIGKNRKFCNDSYCSSTRSG